jgi:hypothetical protein
MRETERERERERERPRERERERARYALDLPPSTDAVNVIGAFTGAVTGADAEVCVSVKRNIEIDSLTGSCTCP